MIVKNTVSNRRQTENLKIYFARWPCSFTRTFQITFPEDSLSHIQLQNLTWIGFSVVTMSQPATGAVVRLLPKGY